LAVKADNRFSAQYFSAQYEQNHKNTITPVWSGAPSTWSPSGHAQSRGRSGRWLLPCSTRTRDSHRHACSRQQSCRKQIRFKNFFDTAEVSDAHHKKIIGHSTTIVITRQHDSISKNVNTIYINIGAYTVHNLIWKNGVANKQSNIT